MEHLKLFIPLFAVMAVIALRSYWPEKWNKLRVPLQVGMTFFSVGIAGVMLYAGYIMWHNISFSTGTKIAYTLAIVVVIVLMLWLNFAGWKKKNENSK